MPTNKHLSPLRNPVFPNTFSNMTLSAALLVAFLCVAISACAQDSAKLDAKTVTIDQSDQSAQVTVQKNTKDCAENRSDDRYLLDVVDRYNLLSENSEEIKSKYNWILGHANIVIANSVDLSISEGFRFHNEDIPGLMNELGLARSCENVVGILEPLDEWIAERYAYASDYLDWVIVVEYYDLEDFANMCKSNATWTEDDEFLETLFANANALRRQQGKSELQYAGPALMPEFDEDNHKFLWATYIHSTDDNVTYIDHNEYALGRRGGLRMSLIADEKSFSIASSAFRDWSDWVTFQEGERYGLTADGELSNQAGIPDFMRLGAIALQFGTAYGR